MDFHKKLVLVTGGSDGIGLATAKQFAAAGAKVYVTARRQDRLAAAVAEIGANAVGVQGDVAKLADLDRLYDQIRRDDGKLDVLFANAGISESAPLGAIDEDQFDRVFGVNVKGLLFSVQKALPLMTTGGAIVLNGSGAGSKGFAALSVYSATKAAIRSFARTWTTDLKARGIRVNVVAPGMIDTPAMRDYIASNPGIDVAIKQMIPLTRLGADDEVAKAVVFLASSDSQYLAGVELAVDGGFLAV